MNKLKLHVGGEEGYWCKNERVGNKEFRDRLMYIWDYNRHTSGTTNLWHLKRSLIQGLGKLKVKKTHTTWICKENYM